MKKTLSLAALLVLFTSSFLFCGNSTNDLINEANRLISNRQYLSAFERLKDGDPEFQNPALTLMMVEVATKYFSKSIMHEMFSFNDLKPGDDPMEIRKSSGSSTMFALRVAEVLEKLIKKYPGNPALYHALGCYYYEVYLKYGGHWLKSDAELLKMTRELLMKAEKMKKADDNSLFDIGMTFLLENDMKNALPYFQKAVKLNGKHADANYNMAYIFLKTKDYRKAVQYALVSAQYYEDRYYKADALRIAANAYVQMNDYAGALDSFDKAIAQNPEDIYSYDGKISVYLRQDKSDAALDAAKDMFNALHDDPETLSMINRDFLESKKPDDLGRFYSGMISLYSNNDLASGNLQFYYGIYCVKTDRPEEAKKAFNSARDRFKRIYKEDHEVFGVIDNWMKSLK